MMLELGLGDAYGAGFEYTGKYHIKKFNNLSMYYQHPKFRDLKPGCYTDDTQMSIGVAELLIEKKEWAPVNIANKFVEVFKRDIRRGYSRRFYPFLLVVKDGQEFLDKIDPISDRSGAAMRSVPLGILKNINDVINHATIQAKLTHNTINGINSSVAVALSSHYFIYDLSKKSVLKDFLKQHLPIEFGTNVTSEPIDGLTCANAGIRAVIEEDSLSKVLLKSINYAGDTDTVATIALGIASSSREITKDLPKHLINRLENKTYGRDYLISLDKKLLKLIKR